MRRVSGVWGYAWAGVLTLGVSVTAHAAGDAQRGQLIAYTCLGCHGVPNYENTYPMYRVPKLHGQHPEYIVSALKAYRSGERSHATMHAQASSMSDEDMQDVAAYLSGTVVKSAGKPVGTAPAATQLCVACHGTDGVGITGAYPTLAGQYEDYLARALTEYRKGDRKNPIMSTFAGQIKEEDIAAIAAFFAQQQQSLESVHRRLTRFSAAE
jgi:cytochrome c553